MHPYGRCPLFDCKVQKAHGPENKQIIWSGPGAEAKLQYVRHIYYTTHTKQWHCGHTCAFARTDLSLYCYCRYSNYQFSHSSYFEWHWLLPSPPNCIYRTNYACYKQARTSILLLLVSLLLWMLWLASIHIFFYGKLISNIGHICFRIHKRAVLRRCVLFCESDLQQ